MCVNKRDVENETREIMVENKLSCINVVLFIVDQIMLAKNGQRRKFRRKFPLNMDQIRK